MDNQDSTPQLIIPNVPDDFCPDGDWKSVFQQYQNEVLANGTVDIPGLSDLSPETIAQLESDVNNLQSDVVALQGDVNTIEGNITTINGNITTINNEINTIDGEIVTINTSIGNLQSSLSSLTTRVAALEAIPIIKVRTGVVSISTGDSTETISFSALPSSSYGVVITPRGDATGAASGKYILDEASQTTTGFKILVSDNPSTVHSLRWTAIHTE